MVLLYLLKGSTFEGSLWSEVIRVPDWLLFDIVYVLKHSSQSESSITPVQSNPSKPEPLKSYSKTIIARPPNLHIRWRPPTTHPTLPLMFQCHSEYIKFCSNNKLWTNSILHLENNFAFYCMSISAFKIGFGLCVQLCDTICIAANC